MAALAQAFDLLALVSGALSEAFLCVLKRDCGSYGRDFNLRRSEFVC